MATVSTFAYTTRTSPGIAVIDVAGFEEVNQSVSVQADGKILVAGFSFYGGVFETDYDYSIVRLNADGTLDTTYGTNGRTVISAEVSIDEGYSLAVQADGSVLVSSIHFGPTSSDYGVIRIKANGALDTTFNTNAAASFPGGTGDSSATVMANADGSVLVTTLNEGDVNVVRLNSNGTLDTTFGDNGEFSFAAPFDIGADGVEVRALANGQWLLAGLQYGGDYPYTLARVNADGSPDITFGNQGVLALDPGTLTDPRGGITVQADGKLLLANNGEGYDGYSIVRLNADGSYDTTFGTDGVVTISTSDGYESPRSITVQADGKIIVAGDSGGDYGVIRLNANGTLDTHFASPDGKNHVDGSPNADVLLGSSEGEIINGLAGADVLQGNGGRDQLNGGAGADVFRFDAISDSYRTASSSVSDRILDFNASQDRIDLIALGFTGIGNGHDGTLAIQVNAAGTLTYLKSYDADADGQRFELTLDGDLSGKLNTTNLLFEPAPVTGTAGADTLIGTPVQEILRGLAGNDRLDGGADDDVLIGGSGRDLLTGGSGNDTFLFTSADDSYRTASASSTDVIQDFTRYQDVIDVSALGYTGLGNGTNHTLKVTYNAALDRTYLKDYDADASGHRFEVSLAGDYLVENRLRPENFVFADATEVTTLGVAAPEHVTA